MPIEAVIFDLDGTLANFNLDYKTMRSEVRSYLISKGVPGSVLHNRESIFEMFKKAEIYFKNASKSDDAFVAVQKEALAIAERFELEAAQATSLLPGASEALKDLKQMNLKLALCTINSEKAANHILQRFQIAGFFDTVVPRNAVKHVKPNPEHFEAALKALKVKPQSTIVIGDSIVDMQSAKEIGAIAVGMPTGIAKMEQLMSSGANFIITSILELPILIKKMSSEFAVAKVRP